MKMNTFTPKGYGKVRPWLKSVLVGLGVAITIPVCSSPAIAQFVEPTSGFSRTNTCVDQTTTVTTKTTDFSRARGFALSGENVRVTNPGARLVPEATFVIRQPDLQFSLGTERYRPGIDSVTVTNQETVLESMSHSFSVFN